jgi:hypothetical protein
MVEQSVINSAEKTGVRNEQNEQNDASEKLRLSLTQSDLVSSPGGGVKTNSQQTLESIAQYKAGRYALVTAEGLSLLPTGIVHGVQHNWDHPGEFAVKMGTAALMGVGMRVLLPEAGAARAVIGGAMTYFMARDAVMPVVNAWSQVSDSTDLNNLHKAASSMADGLGLFTVDMAASMPVGLAADKLTGYALKSTAPGRTFESWKESFYNSNRSPVGKFFNWTQETTEQAAHTISERAQRAADRNLGTEQGTPLTLDEKLRLIKEGGGCEGGGKALTVDEKLDLLKSTLDGNGKMSPDAEAAFKVYLEHKRWRNQQFQNRIDDLLGEKGKGSSAVPADLVSTPEAALSGNPTARGAKGTLPPMMDDPPGGGASPRATVAPENAVPQPPLDKPASTVAQMSVTMRDQAARVTEVDKKIANFKESVESPLTQTMRTGKPPLDEGHFQNNKSLVELASQLETPEHVKQAGFLLEHHRVANIQMGIPDQLPEIVDLNQYSRSVHKNLMDLLRKEGIDPTDVLRGTNSPVFLIFDSKGAGPYTIPAIKGVTDTAVIVLPREYQKMLGIHVAGVYSHELGHDLIFGDLLRFPESLRDQVLKQDVVAAAMKSKGIADVDMEVPGFGKVKKSEFFTKLLLAEANENTADIFGTAIDPNTPLSLASLLGSLRKPLPGTPEGSRGALETRSMYGSEFASKEGNPIGIEPHGIDAWRIKLGAEVLRQLSNHDVKVTRFADSLDSLSESLRRPGDSYVWASTDIEGKFVSIPMKEWDAIIPNIVKAQLETPLPALNNKTLRSVYPNVAEIYPRVDSLAEKFATSARLGEGTVKSFSKSSYPIEDVYSAGLSGWMKALAQNPEPGAPGYIAPEVLLERINGISGSLTHLYAGDNYLPPIPGSAAAPVKASSFYAKPLGYLERGVGNLAAATPAVRNMFSHWANKSSIYAGVAITRDMFDAERRLQDMLNQEQKLPQSSQTDTQPSQKKGN